MDEEAKRRANFRSMAGMTVVVLCGIISTGGPLLMDGGPELLRAVLLAVFMILFVFVLTTALKYRPRR